MTYSDEHIHSTQNTGGIVQLKHPLLARRNGYFGIYTGQHLSHECSTIIFFLYLHALTSELPSSSQPFRFMWYVISLNDLVLNLEGDESRVNNFDIL